MFKRKTQVNALPQLGELELSVMDALWLAPGQGAKDIHAALPRQQRSSLSTVQSTLERLFRKGLLTRTKQGHAYLYHPKLERSELMGRLIGGVIKQLHNGSLEPILSSFVDFADRMDDNTLDQLEQLIHQRRLQRLEQQEESDHD
ncbi:BlaI/MecI/CopY family transcriptional regulator [Pseudomaricurvus alkylphenolicus]|uniref:BlaI/MecI/CopY family transcriptional regulator n=1 Tax=Pseudomaricurvus alkylphenolicus TaxID=1306991 RepID=UPI00141DA4E9|nr:BlaI/MecI/CopY family transcriptional regulator [Pseudomaricurvus alkylphenolicus]NIB38277.1 BlaI/MecI/CopY family transcriptional regulator [Pseudomaricurvus alkylphenolicus]